MKSRRQSSGGSSAGATAAGEGNTHSSGGGCKLERKDVEKNRRLHMKGLCLKLSSLIPPAARRASLLSEAAASASNPNKSFYGVGTKMTFFPNGSSTGKRAWAEPHHNSLLSVGSGGPTCHLNSPIIQSFQATYRRGGPLRHHPVMGSRDTPLVSLVLINGRHVRERKGKLESPSDELSPPTIRDAATQLDQLDSAAAYIKQLKERVDALKRRKEGGGGREGGAAAGAVRMPVVEVRCQDGATLDVVLISEAGRPFKLHEVITALEEEGAEVVSASFSVVGDKIFYTIHSQALSPRIGLDAARVSERLHDLLLLV